MKRNFKGFALLAISVIVVLVTVLGLGQAKKGTCDSYIIDTYGVDNIYNSKQMDELEFDLYEFSDFDGNDSMIEFCYGISK